MTDHTPEYQPKAGDRVTVRRWIQPSLTPGDPARELSVEFTGVIKGIRGDIMTLTQTPGARTSGTAGHSCGCHVPPRSGLTISNESG